jgi:hypothetical protein
MLYRGLLAWLKQVPGSGRRGRRHRPVRRAVEGLASQEEVDRVAAELMTLADDETTLFGFPLLAQVWAVR